MNDSVLTFLKRGHTTEQTRNAISLLKKNNLKFIGQMMVGLPNSTPEDEIDCAQYICESGASGARIYPTLVFRQTELENITNEKKYNPLTLEEAVIRSADVLSVFVKHNIPCIRIGLCESENLHSEDTFVAGPNHPSIGEMVKSELYYNIICSILDIGIFSKSILIYCPNGAISQIIGNKKTNIIRLKGKYGFERIYIKEDRSLESYDIRILNKED